MIWNSSIFDRNISQNSGFLRQMIFRQHTYVSTHSQYFLLWNSIAMESPAVKQYKISSLCVYFYGMIEGLILFVFFRD